jgi:hypothetical protein
MQAAINFGGLSANQLLKRKAITLVLMRRRNGPGIREWEGVELSALNQSTFEMGIATCLIKASTLQLSVSVW